MTSLLGNDFVAFVNAAEAPDGATRRRIDNLPLSADLKAVLNDLLALSTKVGDASLRLGRRILLFVLELVRLMPTLSFTVLLTVVISTLVGTVPVVGGLLSAILAPLGLLLGVTWGAYHDVTSPELASRISTFVDAFKTMN